MMDENAHCNAAMDGAGPAHSEPHDDAERRPIERNPDPPAALLLTRTRRPVTRDLLQESRFWSRTPTRLNVEDSNYVKKARGIIKIQEKIPRGAWETL